MQYTTLGTSTLNISRICLGTMIWGTQNTQAEAFQQMDYALDHGVNFWDTAELYPVPPSPALYGKTETIIGNWFAANPTKRQNVVLATKISPGRASIRNGAPLDAANVHQALDASLARLQTDYIDLYQLHWPNRMNYHVPPNKTSWGFDPTHFDPQTEKENLHEVLHAIGECVKSGKIRHFGLSDDSAWGIITYAHLAEKFSLPKVQSIQNEYSLLARRSEYDVAEACVLEGVSFLPWSPMAMGILTGKYRNGAIPTDPKARIHQGGGNLPNRCKHPNTDAAVTAYLEIARKYNLSIAQMAIAFTLRKPWMSSTIIGASTPSQLAENIAAVNVTLSEDILADINAVYRGNPMPY